MYDLKRSFSSECKEHSLTDAAILAEEGQACVRMVDASGVSRVAPSVGLLNERFAGFSKTANSSRTTQVVVETLLIPAVPGPYTLTLSKSNLTQTSVVNISEISIVASVTGTLTQDALGGGAPGAGQYEVNPTSGVVTFNLAQAGETVVVTYRHNLTQAEINAQFQQRHINNQTANTETRSVALMGGEGDFYTDQFDAALVYTLNEDIRLGAGGRLTNSVMGGVVVAYCIKLPGANADGLLGVRFRTA